MTTETVLTSFRRSVHTFLGFHEDQKHPDVGFTSQQNPHHNRSPSFDEPLSGGLSLIATEVQKPENVLEASALKSILPGNLIGKDSFPAKYSLEKPDPYAADYYDDGSLGFQLCTESLGFESSNEPLQSENGAIEKDQDQEVSGLQNRYKRKQIHKSEMKFPPPLSSMNRDGQSSYFLKPVRKDGRFLLTEVRIDRQEILSAWRHDGRLRLRLVKLDQNSHQEIEPEQPSYKEGTEQEPEEEEEEDANNISLNEAQRNVQWQGTRMRLFPLKNEGLRRCHQQSNHLSFWNARCVTTT